MTEMIDRVAMTLHELVLSNGGVSRGPADMRDDACAIVSAMRIPTEDMADEAATLRYLGVNNGSPAETWTAMIDTALGISRDNDVPA